MVSPVMIHRDHPLFMVNDVFNAVFVHSNMLGDSMYYGKGAGKLPTASAVVADIVDMVKHNNINVFIDWSPEKMELVDYKENVNSFFVRSTSEKAEIEAAFGAVEYVEGVVEGEIGFVTNAMTEADFAEKVEKVQCISRIRLA